MTVCCHLLYETLTINKRKGGDCMIVKKESKTAFNVTGFMKELETDSHMENYTEIARMWGDLTSENMSTLLATSNGLINGFLGVSDEKGHDIFHYLIGVTSAVTGLDGLSDIRYPDCDWLIFDCLGSIPGGAMINLKNNVLLEWLPNSDYDQLPLPRVEVYFEGDMSADSYQSELWVPIKNKR